ncbi:MAG TPA: hypothetical protein VL972_00215 [Solirubrobacteraceae bacterium]|nr:hypothetical protein [Solirubrobacteraceae bacterium]
MRSSRALTAPRVLAAVALAVLAALALAQGVASAGRSHTALPLTGAHPLATPAPDAGETLMGQEGAESRFATSVAVSADATTAIVGTPSADSNRGAVTLYLRSGTTWLPQTELTGEHLPKKAGASQCAEEAGEEAGECGFGRSVALSADGNTAIVGAPQQNGYEGAAWVLVRSGATWTVQAELTDAELGNSHFGVSVALSADGDTALVGAPAAHADRGAAVVFARSGDSWTPQSSPPLEVAAEEVGVGHFGRAVALSGDGNTALVGAPGNAEGEGAAWLFERTGEAWSEPFEELNVSKEGEQGPGRFGAAVALSGDGHTALVGAHENDEGTGAVWTFTRTGLFFAPTGQELEGGEPSAGLGAAVALSPDGHTGLVGAPYAAGGRGAAWELTRSAATWSEAQLSPSGETGNGRTGAAVALSGPPSAFLLGAPRDNHRTGALWSFFEPEPEPEPGPGGGGTTTTTSTTGTETTPTTPVTPTNTSTGSGGSSGAAHSGALALNAVGPPVLGVSGNIAPLSGHVYVELPGSKTFVPLTGLRQVPFGTVVDATHGKVKVTTMTPSGHTQVIVFFAGRFKLTQSRNGLVIASLTGGNFSVCPTRRERLHIASLASSSAALEGSPATAEAFAASASRKHVVRKLWAEGHGKYETKGNYASGAVQGTRWLTEDLCEGTLIHVSTDRVLVVNLVTHHHRSVKAPHNYLAKAP